MTAPIQVVRGVIEGRMYVSLDAGVTWVPWDGSGGGGGGGAVTVADGADAAEGATSDAAWSGSGAGTVVSVLKKIAGGTSVVTGSAPTFVSVGVASAQILAANSRKGLLLTNTSSNFISLGFNGNAAVLYSGLTLTPYGVLELTPAMVSQGAVTAIASGASSNLGIQEFV
jgi:hypothetical protein